MKDGVRVINCARGQLIDDEALQAALDSGKVAGAALDVFQQEPKVHPGLVGREDVVLLPHLGSATEEVRLEMARMACTEIARAFRGDPPLNRVA